MNRKPDIPDVIEVEPGVYSVLIGNRSYELRVNGETADFRGIAVPVDLSGLRDSPQKKASANSGPAKIASPMPGKVIRVLVHEDELVETGQGILVVEAMKMQNEMRAPRGGRVTSIKAKSGATVAAGELLALIE